MHLGKITLVGVGLLGGSLGLAVRQLRLAGHVCGLVRRSNAIAECEKLGVVDQATRHLGPAVTDADLIILCSPIGQMRGLVQEMLPFLKPDAIITDVGSVKGIVVEELEPLAQSVGAHFVGSHPMAGSEKTGVTAARADLFRNAVCVVTPTGRTNVAALKLVNEFWTALGCRLLALSPTQHDDLVSRSSHLPHVVAAELANYVLSPIHPREQALLCANGFRDTTRVASGSPELWRDIALANRQHLGRVLGVFIEDLSEFQRALAESDTKAIEEFFTQARQRRDAWCQTAPGTSPE
jgi:prephenate dehydrogenase